VAAANPLALDSAGLDADIVAREKAILAEKNAGKPANVLERIIESGLKTYYKEVCLLDQVFVIDGSRTVGQVVKEAAGKVGAPVAVSAFARFALGEGIEKKVDDFAAEVAAAAKG
jgi:elongation factor Ts